MTIKELKNKLAQFPDDMLVYVANDSYLDPEDYCEGTSIGIYSDSEVVVLSCKDEGE